jgi:ABC-type nitrate/sulfonate/bicarbonate transport system permease component
MTEQTVLNDIPPLGLARSLAIPLATLLLALLLTYSGAESSMRIPEVLGGDHLRRGLRTIAILLGLSCLPGGLIGSMLAYLIGQNAKLASAAVDVLRVGQWVPFVLWWPLVPLLLMTPGQQITRYFFFWTMSIPAVALGTLYCFLHARHVLGMEWQSVVAETAKLAVYRALYISVVLAFSVWLDPWVVYPGRENVVRHYVAGLILALFLFVANWLYHFGIEQNAALHRKTILADSRSTNEASPWIAALIFFFLLSVWQLLNSVGYFRISPADVFEAAVALVSEKEIWLDMRVSVLEIIVGVLLSGTLAFIVSATLITSDTLRRWLLLILSLTYVMPMVMLPTWQNWILQMGGPRFFVWTATCVACLSFFPVMQTVWALREESLIYRILFAVEHALPYGFATMLYGEMMSATAGLGFTVVVASATYQTEKAFAVFFITLFLLLVLSLVLRLAAVTVYFSRSEHARARSTLD